jgi:hypothetical protein
MPLAPAYPELLLPHLSCTSAHACSPSLSASLSTLERHLNRRIYFLTFEKAALSVRRLFHCSTSLTSPSRYLWSPSPTTAELSHSPRPPTAATTRNLQPQPHPLHNDTNVIYVPASAIRAPSRQDALHQAQDFSEDRYVTNTHNITSGLASFRREY